MGIKKGLMKLILGTYLLGMPLSVSAQEYNPKIQGLKNSLTECIRTNNCDTFENLRRQLGVKIGKSNLDEQELFYYSYGDEKYLGFIKNKEIKDGINIYYADEIVGSSNREFTTKVVYKSGKEELVIGNFSAREQRAESAKADWKKRIDNNSNFKKGFKFDKKMQAEYNATLNQEGSIENILLQEDINCTIAHERIPHYHNNARGEALAYVNEVMASPYALKGIEEGAGRIPRDASEEYYTKVKKSVKNGLIGIAGSERNLYKADRAQLRKYAEQLKQELSR